MSFPLFTVEQVRQMDQQATAATGITGFDLMRRAGQALFQQLQQMVSKNDTVHIFCGAGNNAGDGYVLATLLIESGVNPRVYTLVDVSKLSGDGLRAYEKYNEVGELSTTLPAVLDSGVIVDALVGTGLSKPLTGAFLAAVELINASGLTVLSVDVPSGLNANTGCASAGSVQADTTLSFIALKRGLFTADGVQHSGEVLLDDLSVDSQILVNQTAEAQLLVFELMKKNLLPRAKNTHKGDFGHVLMLGGCCGYSGAIRMAGEAALRAGAGLVSVATRQEHAAFINIARPELMCHGVNTSAEFFALAERCDLLAVGPGLGQTPWSETLFEATLELNKPMVLDADALNMLAKSPEKRDNWVLTPHPAEAARLLGCSTMDIQQDRFAAIKQLQQQYGGVVVLKGAGSLVNDGVVISVCTAGNPGMASAGMGDVLTGIIAALVAQKHPLSEATKLAVMIHALAGDRAAKNGEKGLLASDLMTSIRELVNDY